MEKYEDKIYSLGEAVTGQTQAMSQAVQKTLENNGGGGGKERDYLTQICLPASSVASSLQSRTFFTVPSAVRICASPVP